VAGGVARGAARGRSVAAVAARLGVAAVAARLGEARVRRAVAGGVAARRVFRWPQRSAKELLARVDGRNG
jgi:hypothetical protein